MHLYISSKNLYYAFQQINMLWFLNYATIFPLLIHRKLGTAHKFGKFFIQAHCQVLGSELKKKSLAVYC